MFESFSHVEMLKDFAKADFQDDRDTKVIDYVYIGSKKSPRSHIRPVSTILLVLDEEDRD
jgi:hypothetical protein